MSTTSSEGMAFEDTGRRVPVIMFHGLGGSSNTFHLQIVATQDHRVISRA